MKHITLKFIYLLVALGLCSHLWAQGVVDDANLSLDTGPGAGVFLETIKIISASKKIFILTNNNQQLGSGDFISLALYDKLAARAVVAKTHQGQVGIKILKIYSLAVWSQLKRNLEVQIIKGDDSYFGKKPQPKTEDTATAKINTEEDLYTGDVVSENDLGTMDENQSRNLRSDNLVAIHGSYLSAAKIPAVGGGTIRTGRYGVSWGYQFTDNYFIEGMYARSLLTNYPADDIKTLVNQVVVRLKYNLKGPSYTFFQPYLGYQNNTVSSPDAGESANPEQNDQEKDAISKLQKSGAVVGVTALRRLVPGWFIRADIGTDIINLGFAIEF
jgi:hypothetical protein